MSAEPKPGSVAEIVSVLRRWGGMEEIEDVPESLKRMAFSDMLALADWMENSLAMKKRSSGKLRNGQLHRDGSALIPSPATNRGRHRMV